jgi:hypothetical protein
MRKLKGGSGDVDPDLIIEVHASEQHKASRSTASLRAAVRSQVVWFPHETPDQRVTSGGPLDRELNEVVVREERSWYLRYQTTST